MFAEALGYMAVKLRQFYRRLAQTPEAKHVNLALCVLIAALLHNNLHKLAFQHRGYIWTASNAGFILFLLAVVAYTYRSLVVWAVCGLASAYAAQALACNVWYILDPWPLLPDGEMCSTKSGLPLGTFGVVAAAYVTGYILEKTRAT